MIFDKTWFLKHQTLLKWFANTKYGKGLLGHGLDRVDLILPNAVVRKNRTSYIAEFRTHDKYAKRLYYEFKPIWKAFHWFDMNVANIYVPKLNLGFDSLTAYPAAGSVEPVDGRAIRGSVDETFTTIRNGAGNSSADGNAIENYGSLTATTTSNQYSFMFRCIFCFDTSSIGGGATINSATLSLFGTDKSNGLGSPTLDIVSSTPASTSTLASSDYGNLGTTVFSDIAYASFSTSAYNDFSLNASGLSNISKTSISKFGTRTGWDTDNSFGGSWSSGAVTKLTGYMADQTGTSNDPKLTVTYTLPGGFFYMSS